MDLFDARCRVFFIRADLVMYILLICSIFIITIGIERLLYFMKADSGRAFCTEFL